MAVEIVPLTAQDYDDWAPLWAGYLAFYEARVDPETTRLTFARLTDPAVPEMGSFLARVDGVAVGMTNYVFHRSTWTAGDYCYLQDLFVAPDRRVGGIGRALIDAVTEEARARGASRVHWLTHETNATAMRLYDACADRSGFVQYRRLL